MNGRNVRGPAGVCCRGGQEAKTDEAQDRDCAPEAKYGGAQLIEFRVGSDEHRADAGEEDEKDAERHKEHKRRGFDRSAAVVGVVDDAVGGLETRRRPRRVPHNEGDHLHHRRHDPCDSRPPFWSPPTHRKPSWWPTGTRLWFSCIKSATRSLTDS